MINERSALGNQGWIGRGFASVQARFGSKSSTGSLPQFKSCRVGKVESPKFPSVPGSWLLISTAVALCSSLLISNQLLAGQADSVSTQIAKAPQAVSRENKPKSTALNSNLQDAVGVVSMALGRTYIERGAEEKKVVAGLQVFVGDRLFTEAGGHIHVRFIDDALVSVRPRSTLEVVLYDYDAKQPANSSVKFELTEGIARAISGEAAKSARQRFRLNTPIAAIGVRGTDFVVSADSSTTAALVNEGAIIMAPLSLDCRSDTLGPCSTGAVELGQNSMQLLGIDEISKAPRVLAVTSEGESAEAAAASMGIAATKTQNSAYGEVDTGQRKDSNSASSEVFLESAANAQINTETPASILPTDYTPSVALTAEEAGTSQLVWGRWSATASPLGNVLSIGTQEARLGRAVTISTPAGFTLYRNQTDSISTIENFGRIAFDLNAAEAYYDSAEGNVAMVVKDGSLELDFVEKSFTTALGLFHGSTGSLNLEARGQIAEGGYLRLQTGSQSFSGAVSVDGSEAAYFFDQTLINGSVTGLTLWGAK